MLCKTAPFPDARQGLGRDRGGPSGRYPAVQSGTSMGRQCLPSECLSLDAIEGTACGPCCSD